ncbi:FG-GAP repeat domain-containing protein [Nannocystis radixulma]|uniref:FG-GAP-like repeat-containing protein n=1 Tax=Nannocystis radixulma TaxID=2995305 RepID=A0ABT5B2W6_9BACT|nr:FG-GAP-like repeat-containing protein [Nannocystis radixulma]MDC0667416.1 FG-GAP-like repeat-containing protein [Nannocystis radixulma]
MGLALLLLALSRPAAAAPWQIDPNRSLPADLGEVSQKVELADVDADGFVDLFFATSRGDSLGGEADAQPNRFVRNDPQLGFLAVAGVFDEPDNAYVIKAGDLDRDGRVDLVVGVNYGAPSYVLLDVGGAASRHDLAGEPFSIGDLELGDLDGDGVLDVLAADWGVSQPYGDVGDPGGPLRLFLGDGSGEFSDGAALLPPGTDTFLSWSFDVELLDFDNDFDLDIVAASRGPGPALALRNDAGVFAVHPIGALAGKPVNSAFTVLDLNGDDALDLVTLQDGFGGGRNTVLVGNAQGGFVDNPGAYWALVDNPARLDFDAASLDFHNDGTSDLVVLGPAQNPGEVHARLMLNDGSSLDPVAPDGAAFALAPQLTASFGVQIADFDRDRRPDLAVAVRDADASDAVLFGGPDVPEDSSPPRLGMHELMPELFVPGELVVVRARVHDGRVPARWHDFQHDPQLASYHLVPGSVTAHQRRLPWIEFAYDLADPQQLADIPDEHPDKWIAPGESYGESLWRIAFVLPLEIHDSLTWRVCAIDAADNKGCSDPFTSLFGGLPPDACGNGVLEPWEPCDDFLDPVCLDCVPTCGDGLCAAHENPANCPADCGFCDSDGVCEPGEDATCCDCTNCGLCGDGLCDTSSESAAGCPEDCTCGDGLCDVSEDAAICAADCGVCGDGLCAADESGADCPQDCHVCGDCVCDPPEEDAGNCPLDCSIGCESPTGETFCGDQVCDWDETAQSCPEDCTVCGDGVCDEAEYGGDCVEDCYEECYDCECGSDSDACTTATNGATVDDGLACNCRDAPGGGLVLGLGALLARRRRRDR